MGQTAQLFFRPVDCIISPYIAPTPSTTAKTPTATTTTTAPGQAKLKPKSHDHHGQGQVRRRRRSGVVNPDRVGRPLASARFPMAAGTSTTAKPTSDHGQGDGQVDHDRRAGRRPPPRPRQGRHTTTLDDGAHHHHDLPGPAICNLSSTQQELYLPPHGNNHGVTPASDDNGDATVVLPDYAGYAYGRYVLGPAEMTGSIIKTATANLNSQTDEWEVDISFTGKGSSLFNKYAASSLPVLRQDESNPPYCALQAIELDATVESDPAIEAASFPGVADHKRLDVRPVHLPRRRQNLALALSYGSLPVRFVAQDISNVSPQIGTDSLNAGAIAGAVAVLLVLIYLIIYYRALGLVVVIGICMSGAFIYAITTLLSATEAWL